MRLQTLFHVSFYVTLALAAACLTAPSVFFLWWMPYFLAATFGFFYLAWRYEGVWELSETAANQLGVFIAIGAAGWILFQVPRSIEQLAAGGVNWPAGLLPHLGPLLTILLIVKLFRPKRLPDYWVIQTMGLMMVALAAVLADDRNFGVLLILYFASLVWSLGLYYHLRERALVNATVVAPRIPLFGSIAGGAADAVPWRLWGAPRVALWTGKIALLGFLLFLCAPRQSQSQWNAHLLSTGGSAAAKTGADAGIDLNRVGYVELSDAPAFTVILVDHAGKRLDPANIKHWRQETLEIYAQGRWYPHRRIKDNNGSAGVNPSMSPAKPRPTELDGDQWLVTIQVKPSEAGGLVLAEPVNVELGAGLEPRVDDKAQAFSFFNFPRGWDTFVSAAYMGTRKTYTYSQVTPAHSGESMTPARGVNETFYAESLAKYPAPPGLAEWTRELLQRLPDLSDADRRLNDQQQLGEAQHAKVARALCHHLAVSGEYRYTLDLRRGDGALDPTVDFLMNVKEGHCERYAGGLALMLRSLGVRCRVVKGYLGAETDEDGRGVVRKSQAHSWVQALVSGESDGALQWLTLDPTPATAAPDSIIVSWWNWCKDHLLDTRSFWRQFIMEYTPEQQLDTLASLRHVFASKEGWLAMAFLAAVSTLLIIGRRLSRGLAAAVHRLLTAPARSIVNVAFFDELLRLLGRHGIRKPDPAQTPREFAVQVAAALERANGTGDVADVLPRIVDAYYQVRFGGQPLNASQHAEIQSLLVRLGRRLRQSAA